MIRSADKTEEEVGIQRNDRHCSVPGCTTPALFYPVVYFKKNGARKKDGKHQVELGVQFCPACRKTYPDVTAMCSVEKLAAEVRRLFNTPTLDPTSAEIEWRPLIIA